MAHATFSDEADPAIGMLTITSQSSRYPALMPHVSLPTTSSVRACRGTDGLGIVEVDGVPGDDQAIDAQRIARANDGAQVARAGGAIEDDDEHVLSKRDARQIIVGHRYQRQQLRRLAFIAQLL